RGRRAAGAISALLNLAVTATRTVRKRKKENSLRRLGGHAVRSDLFFVPRRAGMDGEKGNYETNHTEHERQTVRAREIIDRAAGPGAERHAEPESDFEKSENRPDIFAAEDVADDGAVGGISRAVAGSVQHRGRIDEPQR